MAQLIKRIQWPLTGGLGVPATAQGVVPATMGILLPADGGLYLNRVEVLSAAGTTLAPALVVAWLKDSQWVAGQYTTAGTVFTDDTADAQDADTNDFALETTTLNDGFVIASQHDFGVVSLDITTAGVGGTAHNFAYWNGSAYSAGLAAAAFMKDISSRAGVWAAGESTFAFLPPVDWSKTGYTGSLVGLEGKFSVRLQQTTGTPTTAALARRIYVGVILHAVGSLAASSNSERAYPSPLFLPSSVYSAVGLLTNASGAGGSLIIEATAGTPF